MATAHFARPDYTLGKGKTAPLSPLHPLPARGEIPPLTPQRQGSAAGLIRVRITRQRGEKKAAIPARAIRPGGIISCVRLAAHARRKHDTEKVQDGRAGDPRERITGQP